jgi:predicted transporter
MSLAFIPPTQWVGWAKETPCPSCFNVLLMGMLTLCPSYALQSIQYVSMANRIEPFSAISFELLFQRKITYSALISVDSFVEVLPFSSCTI